MAAPSSTVPVIAQANSLKTVINEVRAEARNVESTLASANIATLVTCKLQLLVADELIPIPPTTPLEQSSNWNCLNHSTTWTRPALSEGGGDLSH